MAQMDVAAQAQKLRDESKACRQRSEESFQRSDSDGFLSQWANTIGSRKLDMQADLLEKGNKSTFNCLMYGDRIVCEHEQAFANKDRPWITNYVWKLPDDLVTQLGRRWIPVGTRSRVQKKLGLHEGSVERPAVVVVTTGKNNRQTGLGGCASAYVTIVREDEQDQY